MGRPILLTIALATFASLWLTSHTKAQTIRAYVDVDSISIGERVQLTVAVDQVAPPRAAITFPALAPDTLGSFLRFGDLLVVDILGGGSAGGQDGLVSDSIVYEATTFALDTARTAPLPILLTSGPDTLVLATDAFLLPVRSVVPADAEDIMDLMPVAEFRQPIWPWLLFLAALLVAMAAFIFWYRRSPQQTLIERSSAQPSLPPAEEAYSKLDRLESQTLETDADREQFCVDLSDTLRTYLWRRTAVHALEMTTGELVERIASMEASDEMSGGVSRLVGSVLEVCDLAKFAEVIPDTSACVDEAARTRHVIDRVEEHYAPVPDEIDETVPESPDSQGAGAVDAEDTRGDVTVSDVGTVSDHVESSAANKSPARE